MNTPKRKRTLATVRRDLVRCMEKLATERDKLRELLDEIETMHDIAHDAAEQLGYAIDALSQYV